MKPSGRKTGGNGSQMRQSRKPLKQAESQRVATHGNGGGLGCKPQASRLPGWSQQAAPAFGAPASQFRQRATGQLELPRKSLSDQGR